MVKSEIVLVDLVPNVIALASLLGCHLEPLPMTYLGLPIGLSFKASSDWDVIVEQVERRLANWKLYMSKGGRVTLIKSSPKFYPSI